MRYLLVTFIDMERSLKQRPHYLVDYLKGKGSLHVLSVKYGQRIGRREIKDYCDYVNTIIECRFMDLFNENFLYERLGPDSFYDVVICEGPWAGLLGMRLKDKGQARLYVYEDIDYFPAFFEYDFIYETVRRMENRCMEKADLIFSVSKTLKELRSSYLDSNKIFLSPNGIEKINTTTCIRDNTIIYAGTIDEWSGLDMVLKAYSEVVPTERKSKLLIYGDGKKINEYKNMINRLNIADRAFIKGKIPHETLLEVYNRSLIGLCVLKPTEVVRYSFPIKLLEYMASGLLVVTTKHGDMEGIVSQSGCGILVDYEKNKIKDAILCLLNMDMEERLEMTDKGIKFAKSFMWEKIFEDELNIIQARL
ncbi:MAG: glycosyltransferase [Thermoanaerobacteraceae bacterium]|nr:glycosyltransferase [Thermoanaerobacteraceae bacterium]